MVPTRADGILTLIDRRVDGNIEKVMGTYNHENQDHEVGSSQSWDSSLRRNCS